MQLDIKALAEAVVTEYVQLELIYRGRKEGARELYERIRKQAEEYSSLPGGDSEAPQPEGAANQPAP